MPLDDFSYHLFPNYTFTLVKMKTFNHLKSSMTYPTSVVCFGGCV